MADVKISALPAASSAVGTDEAPLNQGGTTRKATVAQVVEGVGDARYEPIGVDVPLSKLTSQVAGYKVQAWYSGAGAPGLGTLTAEASYAVGDHYWDTVGKAVYECDTAGDDETATWTKVGPGGSVGVTAMVRIATVSVGVVTNLITFGSLNGDVDGTYEIIGRIKRSVGASFSDYILEVNADTTAANYADQRGWGQGGSSGANYSNGGNNGIRVAYIDHDSDWGAFKFTVQAKTGQNRLVIGQYGQLDTTQYSFHFIGWWKNTADNITSLRIANDSIGASVIEVGSYAELWAPRAI